MSDSATVVATAVQIGAVERRSANRVSAPFPAIVRGYDSTGCRFEEETTLENLSGNGLSMQLKRILPVGALLFIVVRLTLHHPVRERGPGVALRGIVVRAETAINGCCAVAVFFVRHRFLFAEQGN